MTKLENQNDYYRTINQKTKNQYKVHKVQF